MSTTLTPNLMTESVNESLNFYRDRLGFRLLMGLPFGAETPVNELSEGITLQFAMLDLDGAMLMLQARDSLAGESDHFAHMPVAASATLYLEVENLDALLAKLGDDVETVLPDHVTFYGMREVWIRDNNGYVLTLAEKHAQ